MYLPYFGQDLESDKKVVGILVHVCYIASKYRFRVHLNTMTGFVAQFDIVSFNRKVIRWCFLCFPVGAQHRRYHCQDREVSFQLIPCNHCSASHLLQFLYT